MRSFLQEAGDELAKYAFLQAGSRAKRPATLNTRSTFFAALERRSAPVDVTADAVLVEPPPVPPLGQRLRDLAARGYGPLSRPLTLGLRRSGLSEREANAAMRLALRFGMLQPRAGGGWTVT